MLGWHYSLRQLVQPLDRIRLSRVNKLAKRLLIGTALAGFSTSALAAPLIINNVGNPSTTGSGQGERGVWVNGGSVSGQNVDIVLEVLSSNLDHTIATTNNRPSIVSSGQDDVYLEWRLYEGGSYNLSTDSGTPIVADVHVQFNDIDGPNNERLYLPACAGAIDWIRIDASATTGLDFDTVSGQVEIVSVIGDQNYNQQPESGVEVLYSNVSEFQMGRTADSSYLIRLDNPTYSEFTTLDYQCGDFNTPFAVDDMGTGTASNSVSLSILSNDAIATANNNAPNNNSLTASEYGLASVNLDVPTGATAIATDADGDVIGFTVAGEGSWSYVDGTGMLTYTPLVVGAPTPITYAYDNVLGATSNTATVTIAYPAALDANPENFASIDGAIGGTTSSILASDTFNGAVPTLTDVNLSIVSTVPEIDLDIATGLITIAPATAAGNYAVLYSICEIAVPSNCAAATEIITVTNTPILAVAETGLSISASTGGMTPSILASDTLNGVAATLASVNLSIDSSDPQLSLNVATGLITVAAATPAGNYTIDYTICEIANPINCASVTEMVAVTVMPIVAVTETGLSISASTGGVTTSILASDTLGATPVSLSDVNLTIDSSDPQLSLNVATGLITVAAATPAGNYSVDYTICEIANPINCASITEMVVVTAMPIIAVAETGLSLSGTNGGTTTSILASDTLGGTPINLIDVNLTIDSSDPELTLDPSTGLIIVAAGTAAGTYSVDYTICEIANPINCASVTETVSVTRTPILAVAEADLIVSGVTGGSTTSILASDLFNGLAASLTDLTLSVVSSDAQIILDPTTGLINVAPGTMGGTYRVDYQICETAIPTNCATATETVTITNGNIIALSEAGLSIPGADGGTTISVLTSDTLGGSPVVLSAVTLSVGATTGPIVLDPATGLITVPADTPAGAYTVQYSVCENLYPSNCASIIETVTVTSAPLIALAETGFTLPSIAGGMTSSIFASDTMHGVALDLADVTISVTQSDPEITLDLATGLISVAPNTAAGTYSLDYSICETLNPTNCAAATETVSVTSAAITAMAETGLTLSGLGGGVTTTILASDMLNGAVVDLADITISIVSTDAELSLDPQTGLISVGPATMAGNYTVDYTICENLNPANCASATETVTVSAAPIVAIAEIGGFSLDGLAGGTTTSILASDTLNAASPVLSDVTITIVNSDTEIVLDPATGLITVAANTMAGAYTIEYSICENLNPSNCATAIENVTVTAAPLVASAEADFTLNGLVGGVSTSILTSDTRNGALVSLSDITLSVVSSDSEITLDPTTGLMSVAASTMAGTYSVEYSICETLNPTNCATAIENMVVTAPSLTAVAETGFAPISSLLGGTTISLLTSDTLGGVVVDPTAITLSGGAITGPQGGDATSLLTLNADGTVNIAPNTPEGTYVVNYTICEILNPTNCSTLAENIVVDPSTTNLSGIIYLDLDDDQTYQAGEPLYVGWNVDLRDTSGNVLTTVTTDTSGYYEFSDLAIGTYSVAFRNPDNNVAYSVIENIELDGSVVVIDQNLPIDPSGVVYDSVARTPITGVTMTMLDAMGTALPDVCFIDASQQNQVSDNQGRYRFDLLPGAALSCPAMQSDYTIGFAAPTNFTTGISTVLGPLSGPFTAPVGVGPYEVSPIETAPQNGDATDYYLGFTLGSGSRDIINNHIPLDAVSLVRAPLNVVKTSPKSTANFAGLVPYTIQVTNTESLARIDLDMIDYTPAGFKYVDGSASLNGVKIDPVKNGRELIWADHDFTAGETKTINLMLVIGAGVSEGEYTNQAFVRDGAGIEISNRGDAKIRVVSDPVFDCSELIGKVFDDRNQNGVQDKHENGLPGVRLATAKGLLVTTDQHGRYHIACAATPNAQIGSNFIIKIDERTLPNHFMMTTENPRVVRLTRGKMSKANFGASGLTSVALDLADAAFAPNSIALTPQYVAQLPALIGQLKMRPSTLSLNYQTGMLDQNLSNQRLSALSDHIQSLWQADGCCYPLDIQTKIIRPDRIPPPLIRTPVHMTPHHHRAAPMAVNPAYLSRPAQFSQPAPFSQPAQFLQKGR